ncbi:hypothetical protein [Streptococcus minor]|uniref:hypothetical protein n=1 Tax=Streptococcus minor TaxID=229549 RepID=UPI000360D489|nr:hypothetical protein [Streptococcus minor]MDO5078349.1 hypothetical protein [Streptococcus minor]
MKKKSMKSLLKLVLASLSAVLLLIGLSACSFFQGESIDGSWTSPTGAEAMYKDALAYAGGEAVFTYSDHKIEEILTKAELELNVTDDKASFVIAMHVDDEAFFTALKDEQDAAFTEELKKMGYTYEELDSTLKAQIDASRLSDEKIRELVSQSIEQMATSLDGTYDKEKGAVTAMVFEGDVDRTSQTVKVTKTNAMISQGLLSTNEFFKYSQKGNKLTLKGQSSEDDLVFEKK